MSAKDIPCNTYRVLKQLGSGGFGKVYKCITLDTEEIVAVKVIPKKYGWYAENELTALTELRKHGGHESIVSLNRHFVTKESYILEFEKLDMTLDDLIIQTGRPLHLNEIQEVSRQIVKALNTLRTIRMAHMDIKPDNIMLVNHKRWPFKVKLIDFGLAFSVDKLTTGYKTQTIDYRAPEVILGLPLTEAVDIWSLGCIVAFMFFGKDFYSARCEFDRIREMVRLQGQPEDKLLNSGIYSKNFFFHNVQSVSWELLEQCDCHVNGLSSTHNKHPSLMLKSLDEIMKDRPNTAENEDMPAFVNLFKQMMEVDPEKRITTENALWHSFFQRKHFPRNCDLTQQGRLDRETCITTNEENRLEEPAVNSKLKYPIHMKEASITNLDDSHSVLEETAACTSKECTLTKPPLKPKSRVTFIVQSEGASSTKVADALSNHKKTAAYIKLLSSLKKAPAKSKHMGKSRIHMKEAANTNLDASHPVQEETATCTSKECRLMKPPGKLKTKAKSTMRTLKKTPGKPKNKAKSTTRIEVASSTKSKDSLSDHKVTTASINAEGNLKKAPGKPKKKAKSTTRIEVASSTKSEDSLSDHKVTTASVNAEGNLKKAPEKPKSNGKSRIQMKDTSNTKFNKSLADHKDTAAFIKAVSSPKKTIMQPKHKEKSRIHMEEAAEIKFNECRQTTPQKKPKSKAKLSSSTPSCIAGVFKKIRRFFKSRFTCFKS